MFESQFGLRENPFAAGHQSRFVYPSREHQEALAHLRFGIENREPFVLITGEVGTGKTTALYDVLAEYESRAVVALITNSALNRDEMLEEICLRFGLPSAGQMSKPQALVALEAFLKQTRTRGQHAILILDEAQNLERNLLEEIRLLSNLEDHGNKLIQIFLVGQPELEEKLAQAELRQLRQRITVFYRLSPLSLDDTERYIHHRISVAGGHALSIFPADACREVFEITHGIPREINTVAGQAMLNAFVEDSPVVKPEHVRIVERDSEFKSVLRGGGGSARISTLDATEGAGAAQGSGAARAPGVAKPASAHPVGAPAGAQPTVVESPRSADNPPMSGANAPQPPQSGPPPLIPAEPPAPAAAEGAPATSPVHGGPPPLHPAEPAAPAPAASAGTPSPTPAASDASSKPPSQPSQPSQTRRPGAPAPAGTAEAWGSWLSSLAHLPSTFDEKLADDIAAATQGGGADPSSASSPGAAAPAPVTQQPAAAPPRSEPARADVSAPASASHADVAVPASASRAESAPPAPARVEPPAHSEVPTPSAYRAESALPPPSRVEPPADWDAALSGSSTPGREEVPTHSEFVHAETSPADHAESHHDVPPASPAESTSGVQPQRLDWMSDWDRKPRRLEFVEEEPAAEGAKTLRWMLVAGVIAVMGIGAVLGIRTWRSAAKHAQSQTASAVSSTTTPVDATGSSPAPSMDPAAPTTPDGAAAPPVVTPPAPAPARGAQSPAVASAQPSPATTTVPAAGQRTTATSSVPSSPTRASSTTPSTAGTQSGGTTAAAGGAGSGAGPSAGGAAAGGVAAGSAGGAGSAATGGATASGASGGAAASGAAGGAGVSGASAGGAAPGAASGAPAASSASSPSTSAAPAGAANGASAGSAPAPASQGVFGIAVGTYLFEDRAEEERVKLSASTSLPARVITVTETDETVYRLVLGSFDSRKSAERTASSLIERGLVDEARVVPLSSTTASKQ